MCIYDTFIVYGENMNLVSVPHASNNTHFSLNFTLELKSNLTFHFLGVQLQRKCHNSRRKSICRKPTWNRQFVNFHISVFLSKKIFLIQPLFSRVRTLLTKNRKVFEKLVESGFPLSFTDKDVKPKNRVE
ncbi:unnamed protein product [Heterobilharzia americana]|nr:unnamed protein product [Heterobilharzia americana]CAH8587240.1 unnamed protein product [Heterobilharzia americana]